MTEEELKLELKCYQIYINPDCDINNMKADEVEDFFEYYKKSETYINSLSNNLAKISDSEILKLIKNLCERK